ncbi:MAG: peptidase S10 [Hyphomicrobiaceae bacterium]|nr:peptidase S10 [Hyphomicrobiaceae bacterium]
MRAVAVALVLTAGGPGPEVRAEDARPAEIEHRLPQDSATEHALELPDRTLRFKATAGSIPITNAKGKVLAEMGYVAYTLDGMPAGHRPVTFALNGGPGSASAWLHIGTLGPWRVRMEEAAESPSAPAPLLPNAETWLDFTDLVFIDPVGTGYSQIVADGGDKNDGEDRSRRRTAREGGRDEGGASYFWSISGDVDSISEFIQKWTYKNERLASPKLLVGESYGGFRAPKIARRLHSHHGIALNALVLVSPVLDFGGRRESHPPLAFVSLLPSLAAAEMERRGEDVSRERLDEVEEYARGQYLNDLMRGPRDAAALERVVTRVAQITGLPEVAVRRYGGRIGGRTYSEEVNRPNGKVASMYDASIRGLDPDPTSRRSRYRDPFTTALNAPMTSAMLELYGGKLNYRTERRYIKMNGEVNRSWIWGNSPTPPESVSELREALALDQSLRALVVHGYTDLVTPYFASELVLDQLPAYGEGQRVASVVYPGGHMFYSRDRSRKAFREDAFNLVERIIVEANANKPPAPAPSIAPVAN